MAQRSSFEKQRGHRRGTGRSHSTNGAGQPGCSDGEKSAMKRWAEWLYDRRLAASIALLLLTSFFAWQLRHLDISTHFSDLYPRNHPYVKTFEKYPAFGS